MFCVAQFHAFQIGNISPPTISDIVPRDFSLIPATAMCFLFSANI